MEKLTQQALYIERAKQRAIGSLRGQELFERNCNSCHPGRRQKHHNLDRMLEKLGEEYFGKFVTNEDSLLEAEDPRTIWINKSYSGGHYIHTFGLDKKEINQLIEYLK